MSRDANEGYKPPYNCLAERLHGIVSEFWRPRVPRQSDRVMAALDPVPLGPVSLHLTV
jgi:hypothetical protein